MKIRQGQIQDFLQCAALDRRAWLDNAHPEFIADGEHVWRIWVEHALCFCAINEQQIAGVILAFACESDSPLYCVHKVMVDKPFRGKGVGSELFSELLQHLDRKGATSFLTVDPQNKHAIALYQKWGFHEQVLHKGFYRDYEDRLVLTRRHNGF